MPVADEARLQGQEAACLGEMKSEQDFPWSLEVAGEDGISGKEASMCTAVGCENSSLAL